MFVAKHLDEHDEFPNAAATTPRVVTLTKEKETAIVVYKNLFEQVFVIATDPKIVNITKETAIVEQQ